MEHILRKYMTQFSSLTPKQQQEIIDNLNIKSYKKGTILLRQGEVPDKCYFVLKGCVRQYSLDGYGDEYTSNFYTEEQAIASFSKYKTDPVSLYTLSCLENSVLVVGDLVTETNMYNQYTELEKMTRKMIEMYFGTMQEEFATFINSSPEERYKSLLRNRPDLIDRVPQHQLASFIGITPESLSRIKKRINFRDF